MKYLLYESDYINQLELNDIDEHLLNEQLEELEVEIRYLERQLYNLNESEDGEDNQPKKEGLLRRILRKLGETLGILKRKKHIALAQKDEGNAAAIQKQIDVAEKKEIGIENRLKNFGDSIKNTFSKEGRLKNRESKLNKKEDRKKRDDELDKKSKDLDNREGKNDNKEKKGFFNKLTGHFSKEGKVDKKEKDVEHLKNKVNDKQSAKDRLREIERKDRKLELEKKQLERRLNKSDDKQSTRTESRKDRLRRKKKEKEKEPKSDDGQLKLDL